MDDPLKKLGSSGLQPLDDDGEYGNGDDVDDGEDDDGVDDDNGAKSVWWLTACRRTKRATVFYIEPIQGCVLCVVCNTAVNVKNIITIEILFLFFNPISGHQKLGSIAV